jgi:GT2 family glycosyltransferase
LAEPNLPRARNVGIHNSSGELVLFVDDDVIVDNDFISRHVMAHTEGRNIGAVTGLVIDTDRPEEASLEWCRKAFNVPDVTSSRIFDVSWAFGGNTSYRRTALIDAGLFDVYFRGCAIGEDNDASERVIRSGYRIVLDTRIRLQHLHIAGGGCEVRNPAERQRALIEQFELTMYRVIKRFFAAPSFESITILLSTLRQYTISRSLFRQGAGAVIRRELDCIRALVRILKRLCGLALSRGCVE